MADKDDAGNGGRKCLQAVVIVHGMGEQKPMSTLRGFVEAVWSRDTSLTPEHARVASPSDPAAKRRLDRNQNWIVPDGRTGSHEQRRITTPFDVNGRRTDFYELYWADLTQDNTRQRLTAWVKSLLWRKRSDIPDDAASLYNVTALLTGLVIVASVATAVSAWSWGPFAAFVIAAVASILFWAIDHFAVPYFGDVAAYVRSEAATVEKRALVRERGLALLRTLMDDDAYDRVVLVSHSLGSIIAYDLIQILWAEYRPHGLEAARDRKVLDAVIAVEKYAVRPGDLPGALPQGRSLDDFRLAQWRLYEALRGRPVKKRWKISDFVTVGSPLTHAEFLVTHNAADWRQGVLERQFAICPPLSDKDRRKILLYVEGKNPDTKARQRAIYHGAIFAATRWTNIHDIGNLWSTGDPISGTMAENFGCGIEDIRVRLKRKHLGRLFTHTYYWSLDESISGKEVSGTRSHVEVLRHAVDLGRRNATPPGS